MQLLGGGTDLVKNNDKSVASNQNITNEKTAENKVDIETDADKQVSNSVLNNADAGEKTAMQSFSVPSKISRINENTVKSNLTQDQTNDDWSNLAKHGYHYTNAGWTRLQQDKDYTSVAKESHTILLNSSTGKELEQNHSYEVSAWQVPFGTEITAKVDRNDIKQGNRILLSSVVDVFKDSRSIACGTRPFNINVVSNGVKVGHIEVHEDGHNGMLNNGTYDNSYALEYELVVDQTQNVAQDLDLHIKVGMSNQFNMWGAAYQYLHGTTVNNPVQNKLIVNNSTSYNYNWYIDPNFKYQVQHYDDSNNFGIKALGSTSGIMGLGNIIQNPDKSFTSTDYVLNRVIKISRPKEISGIEIPNFKSINFNPYFQIRSIFPLINKDGIVDDAWASNPYRYGFNGIKLADDASVQQVSDAAKDKHFVFSVSSDGQSVLIGMNIPLGREKLNKLTGIDYTVDDAIKDVKDNMNASRIVVIGYPDQANDITNRSVNWVKTHNAEPYSYDMIISGLPVDTNQPVVETATDVTLGVTNPSTKTETYVPQNSSLSFDVSVFRNINVKYVDDADQERPIGSDVFQTTTGTDLTYNIKRGDEKGFNSATDIAFPSNYILNQKSTIHYGVVKDTNPDIIIHVKHLIKTVDGSTDLDLYPNIKKALNGDSTRTFHITYPAGRQGSNPSTIVQSVHFTRSGKADFTKDSVDNATLTAWVPVASTAHGVTVTNGVANFDSITIPRIAGYKAKVETNKANPAMFMVSFVAAPASNTDHKDIATPNDSKSNHNITAPDNTAKHDTVPSTPSVIESDDKNVSVPDWQIKGVKTHDYLVSNDNHEYELPIVNGKALNLIKTSDVSLAFNYIKLNTPSDYVFILRRHRKMYQLDIKKQNNGKWQTVKTLRSHNYKSLMKALSKLI